MILFDMAASEDRRESDSSSTSYKSSFHGPEAEDELPELVLVNPCHAAPVPIAELQPFSSRQSRNAYQVDSEGWNASGKDWPAIAEQGGDAEKSAGVEGQPGAEDEVVVMSQARMLLIASGMLLTYFLGVSVTLFRRPVSIHVC